MIYAAASTLYLLFSGSGSVFTTEEQPWFVLDSIEDKSYTYKEDTFIDDVVSTYFIPEKTDFLLPLIIKIGHPSNADNKEKRILEFIVSNLDEPCIVLRSGILDGLKGEDVRNRKQWNKNSERFKELLIEIKKRLPVIENRVYLTGLSYDGIYAVMLAFSFPELCAGVVGMSTTLIDIPAITKNLQNSRKVPAVIVMGNLDWRYSMEKEKVAGRAIEELNPASKWVLKDDRNHQTVFEFWPEYLNYILGLNKVLIK